MALFVKGLIVGFAIAAPVGPIGVLCISRTLTEGRLRGLATGVGAAVADALYGGIAGFGLNMVAALMLEQLVWIRVIGGSLLCLMGYKILRTKVDEQTEGASAAKGIAGAFASSFFLTLTNPLTLLSFAAVLAGLRLHELRGQPGELWLLVLGIFAGSSLWWIVLTLGTGLFRRKLSPRGLRWINLVSGAVVIGFGLFALFLPKWTA